MINNRLFPRLKPAIKFKKRTDCVIIYGKHPSQLLAIHPSEAFVFNFCTGKYSIQDITYLYGETYNLSRESAIENVQEILTTKKLFVDFYETPSGSLNYFHKPEIFLFKLNEREVEKISNSFFLAGINLSLTLTCNFNCKYCYQSLSLDKSQERLTLQKCLSLVEQASELGMIHFGLTGGEPTLFKEWIALIESVIQHDMLPTFTSNGVIIGSNPTIAEKLSSCGLEDITISLDASTPDLHHYITNSSNTFNTVLNAIRYLLDNGIRVSVKCVLSSLNITDLGDFIDFIAGMGVHEVGITSMEGGASGAGANYVPKISKQQYSDVLKIIKEKGREYKDSCTIHPPSHSSCLWNENDWFPCGGLTTGMSIFPNGDVTICDKLFGVEEFTYGNIFDDTLLDIWNGKSLQAIRDVAINKDVVGSDCAKCSKLVKCKTSCFVDSFNEFGNYYMKHPKCRGPL